MRKTACVILFLAFLATAIQAGAQAVPPVATASQVTVTEAATLIKAVPMSGYRFSLIVKNAGANTIWIGLANSVTKSNGFPLGPGEWLVLDHSYPAVYGICDTGLSSTAAYIEESK